MRMVDLIIKKRQGFELNEEEIRFWINGYVKGEIPDYQISPLLMAICLKGMTFDETLNLTDAMLHSGDLIDLSKINGEVLDKHSTGGVGDSTSLALAPILASLNLKFAKMSGRGLGITGGTLDKLESIPGVTISLTEERFLNQVNLIGLAIAGQTQNLVPADKKLYALRDVTGTVQSYYLIASSIMSKKLASGADVICLDVKYGSGAFMKTKEEAAKLSDIMISIANAFNKKAICFITDMSKPLGKAIGNRLEVKEAVDCVNNKGPKDLEELCLEICAHMILYSNIKNNIEDARKLALEKLRDGSAYKKFLEFIKAQGSLIDNFDNFIECKEIIPLLSKRSGYLKKIDALTLGLCSMKLGAGRETKEDSIDPNVGIVLNKQVNDYIEKGEPILYIYKNDKWDDSIIDDIYNNIEYSDEPLKYNGIIEKIIQ